MDTFKLKVIIGDAQIELEGAGELVHTIFQELRENGLGLLASNPAPSYNNDSHQADCLTPKQVLGEEFGDEEQTVPNDFSLDDTITSLENVVLAGTPNTESEWLLVYAAYCSEQGKKLFTRDDLKNKYTETNRVTASTSKNFSKNLKSLVSDKYISAVNSDSFRMESAGISKAKSIIQGNERSTGSKKNKATTKKKMINTYKVVELDWSEEQLVKIKEFWGNHTHPSNMDKAVLAAYWLKNGKQIDEFTADLFFTILRTVGEGTSFDLGAAIRNAKKDKSYFVSGTNAGAYKISHIGEDHVGTLVASGDSK